MGFQRTFAAVCGALLAAFAAGVFWVAFGAPQWAGRSAGQRRTGEEIARQNERDYHYKGEITGRVLLDNGHPAVGFVVRARFVQHQTGAPGEGEAVTDAMGNYRLHGLNPQAFRVEAESGNQPYVPDPARTIQLTNYPNKIAANVNFTLHLGPQITVRVRDAESGAPVPGLVVSVSPFAGSDGFHLGQTNAQGEFRFRANSLNTQIRLSANKIPTVRVDPAPGYGFYHTVLMKTIADVVWEVKTYKSASKYASSQIPATFRGVVKDAHGTPVSGATVHLLRSSRDTQTTTDSAGRFSFQTTRIESFENRGAILRAEKANESAIVFPTAEQTWGEIAVQLQAVHKPSVTGRVIDASGKPQSGVPIEYFEAFLNSSAQYANYPKIGGATDTSGRFTVSGLSSEAAYRFSFGRTRFPSRTAWGTTLFPLGGYSITPLRLKEGEKRDIGDVVVFAADAVIEGRIVSKRGVLPSHLLLEVRGEHTYASSLPDASGNFHLKRIVREPLRLGVYQSVDGGSYRSSPGSPDDVYQGAVRAGNTNVRVVLR